MSLSLQEKLNLWVSITGVNPTEEDRKYTVYFDGRLSDWDIKKMNDRIKETLEDDETGMFTEAYLTVYLKQFLEGKSVSLLELMENKDLEILTNDIRTLFDSLKETDAESVILDKAKKAMEFYNLPCNLDVLSVIELRTSAMRCMNGKLGLLRFSSGKNKADSFKLSRDIYMFDNLDALILCSARGNLNGVTLGYIRDAEDVTYSYFAFIIKNGDNLYLLTDMPRQKHPAQRKLTRCAGRDMSNRIENNFFPYNTVANIDISDLWDRGRYGTKETKSGMSTVINEDTPYAVIGSIESLNEEEAFWFIMMISLIKDKFYEKEAPELPISYTRSMINSPLLDKTENTLIIQESLPSIELGEISISDTKNLNFGRTNEEYIGMNNYLIDRYKDKVDKSVLNIIKNTDKHLLIEDKYTVRDYWGKKTGCKYLSLDLDNTASTKEEIERNQKWIARYNYARALNDIIKADCEEKTSSLYNIVKKLIYQRVEKLIDMHLKNELLGVKISHKKNSFGTEITDDMVSFSDIYEFNKWYNGDIRCRYCLGFEHARNKPDFKCYFTGKQAGVSLVIHPRTAKELALVCGISVDELPIELQHYDNRSHKYIGNSILEDVDPFLSEIEDVFNKLDFKITILLSKSKYLDFCKKAGLEPVKFWENEKPVCFNDAYYSQEDRCNGSFSYKSEYDSEKGYWVNRKHLRKKCENCKWRKTD